MPGDHDALLHVLLQNAWRGRLHLFELLHRRDREGDLRHVIFDGENAREPDCVSVAIESRSRSRTNCWELQRKRGENSGATQLNSRVTQSFPRSGVSNLRLPQQVAAKAQEPRVRACLGFVYGIV